MPTLTNRISATLRQRINQILEDMYLNIVSTEYINSISDLSCGLPLKALLTNFGKDVICLLDTGHPQAYDAAKTNYHLLSKSKPSHYCHPLIAITTTRRPLFSISLH